MLEVRISLIQHAAVAVVSPINNDKVAPVPAKTVVNFQYTEGIAEKLEKGKQASKMVLPKNWNQGIQVH